MLRFWSFAFTLTILCTFGVAMVNARREIYLSPNGKEIWNGSCGRDFALKLASLSTAAGVDRCSFDNPCRLPNFPISAGPCNLHFFTGNYGGARVDYYGDLIDAPVPEVNITFGDDVRNFGSVSGLSLDIHIMTDLEALGTPRMNIKSAHPSYNVILTGGRMIVNDLVRFNAYVSGIDFIDFPITAASDLVSTVYSGLISFDKCSFQYTQAALLFYVRPPSRFFPSPEFVHFEAHFTNTKISANRDNPDSFIVGYNMTELGFSMKDSRFAGGVLLLAEPGGLIKDLNFENSVITTSAQSLFVPSPRRGLGIFGTLNVLGGTRLHSSGKAFNFFPPGYPANPGTGIRYSEQLVLHDVNLEGVSIRASFSGSSTSVPALKNVSCNDCSIYLNAAGEPYFEGHNRFVLKSSTSSLRLNFGAFTSVFHMGQMTVYVKPELEVQKPFFLNPVNAVAIEGSLTTNMVTLAPAHFQFLSELKITEFASTYMSGKPASISGRQNSIVTLGSINAFDVSLELQLVSVLNYLVTDPTHGIQLSPDIISPGVSVHLPNLVNIIWSPEIPPPQLNVWYPLASFVDRKPQQITVDQHGPLKGLHAELALQPFKSGQQAVFRFYH